MADLQLSALPASSVNPIGLLPAGSPSPSEHPDVIMGQAIFKLSTLMSGLPDPGSLPNPAITPPVLEAMQRLVQIIQQLRSPTGGWSAGVAPTPDNLLPYVLEEAYDLVDAVQQHWPAAPGTGAIATATPTEQPFWDGYFTLKQLMPWLLWGIARSSDEVMQLMEGIAVRTCQPGQPWQTGIVRLVGAVEVDLEGQRQLLDLTTEQPAPALLAIDTLIQAELQPELQPDTPPDIQATDRAVGEAALLCPQPTPIAELLQQLSHAIQTATPSISHFFEGVAIEMLMPRQGWQAGLLTLRLGLAFIPQPAHALALAKGASESQPRVRFTDVAWCDRYRQAIAQQQLSLRLSQLPAFQAALPPATHSLSQHSASNPDLILPWVTAACDWADDWQQSPTLSSRKLIQAELPLDRLMLKLLWCLSHSSYEVMQLLGGVQARWLQPGQDWQTGMLRLVVILHLKTPEHDWQIDLATGRSPVERSLQLTPDAVLQSDDNLWCHYPDTLAQLHSRVLAQLDAAVPELRLLRAGTAVDLLAEVPTWQPGALQITTDLAFL